MTRSKKSRKPSAVVVKVSKEDKKALNVPADKKPKKKTGKAPGSRQIEALKKVKPTENSNATKDPRIGSKKPIELGKIASKASQKVHKKVAKASPIAAIRVLDHQQDLSQELTAIETDAQLQDILAKQDQNIALTEQEVDYFNNQMTRHQAISAELGLDESSDQETASDDIDDEDLWDKLDSVDFSDFE